MPLKGSGLPLSFAKEPWSAFPLSRLEAAQDNFEVGLGRLSFPGVATSSPLRFFLPSLCWLPLAPPLASGPHLWVGAHLPLA